MEHGHGHGHAGQVVQWVWVGRWAVGGSGTSLPAKIMGRITPLFPPKQ